jgi:hypothetical protein
MNLALLMLAPFALLLPGLAVIAALRLPVRNEERPLDLGVLLAVATLLSVVVNAWLALTLAAFGRFSGWSLGGAWLLLGLAAAWQLRQRPAWPRLSVSRWSLDLALLLGGAAFLFAHPAEYLFGIYDPGIYVNVANAIGRNGSILVPDPELPRLAPSERHALFGYVPAPWHRSGMPFLTVHDAAAGELEPEWFHLFPAWLALWGLAGDPLVGTPVLALVALAAVALFGRLTIHPLVGLGAAFFLALNPGEVWFARYPMAEMLAQVAGLAGFVFLALASAYRSVAWAALAGAAFGSVHLAKIDLLVLPATLGAALALRWLSGQWGRRETAFLLGYAVVGAQAVAHALLFARFYLLRITLDLLTVAGLRPWLDLRPLDRANLDAPYSLSQLGQLAAANWWLALPLLALAAAGAFLLALGHRFWPRRQRAPWPAFNLLVVSGVALLCLWAFFLRPVVNAEQLPTDPAARQIALANRASFVQLSWYLSIPGLVLAVVGLTAIIVRRPNAVLVLFALCGASAAIAVLAQGLVTPTHFWAFRRYLPLAAPALSLGIAYALLLVSTSWRPWGRPLATAAAGLIVAQLVPTLLPFLGQAEYAGARAQLEALVRHLPPQGVVLIQWGEEAARLATPLQLSYGFTVFALEDGALSAPGVRQAVQRWTAEGRAVVYLTPSRPAPTADGLSTELVARHVFDVPTLEATLDRLPRTWQRLQFAVDQYRLQPQS